MRELDIRLIRPDGSIGDHVHDGNRLGVQFLCGKVRMLRLYRHAPWGIAITDKEMRVWAVLDATGDMVFQQLVPGEVERENIVEVRDVG